MELAGYFHSNTRLFTLENCVKHAAGYEILLFKSILK